MAEGAKDKLMELLLSCNPRPNLRDTNSIIAALLAPPDTAYPSQTPVLSHMQAFFNSQPDFQEKDTLFLVQFTSEGVSNLKRKLYQEAKELFSKALRHASHPDKSTDSSSQSKRMSQLFAYRSECSFFLEQYEACLRDIDYALQADYKDKHVLHDRQGKCYICLQYYDKAAHCFKQGKKALPSDTCQKDKDKWLHTFNEQIKSIKGKHVSKSSKPKNDINKNIPQALRCKTDQICSTSGDLKIKASEEFGHYVVSNSHIPAGKAVLKSEAYASVLFEECRKSSCYGCFCTILASFPCRSCSGIVYCGPDCEQTSWNSFHRYECSFQEWLNEEWSTKLGHITVRLAMKTLKHAVHKHFKDTISKQIAAGTSKDGDHDMFYNSIDDSLYNDLLLLVRHEKSRDAETNVQMVAICVLLHDILHKSGCIQEEILSQYPDIASLNSNSMQVFILDHLLCMMQISQCNGFTIAKMRNSSDMAHSKPKDMGLGIYLHCSYFNHSCDPDVDITFHGDTMVIHSVKDIRKGEQVFCDYGFTFYLDAKAKRRDYMRSQYFFECTCRACIEDWPLWKDMETKQPRFKCIHCDATLNITSGCDFSNVMCSNCDVSHDIAGVLPKLSASHEAYKLHMEQALAGDRERALPGLLQHLQLLQTVLQPPWREYYGCQAAVKQCFRLCGNTD